MKPNFIVFFLISLFTTPIVELFVDKFCWTPAHSLWEWSFWYRKFLKLSVFFPRTLFRKSNCLVFETDLFKISSFGESSIFSDYAIFDKNRSGYCLSFLHIITFLFFFQLHFWVQKMFNQEFMDQSGILSGCFKLHVSRWYPLLKLFIKYSKNLIWTRAKKILENRSDPCMGSIWAGLSEDP